MNLRVALTILLLVLMFLSTMSKGDDLDKKLQPEFRRLRKKTLVELCESGCDAETKEIWEDFMNKYFPSGNVSFDAASSRIFAERRRCAHRCQEIQ